MISRPPQAGFRLRHAARLIHRGGVVAYPTEGVYGLGCDPLNPDAVARVLAIKGRSKAKGLILIGANYAQLAPYVAPLRGDRLARVLASWPGPVTWLLPARPGVPPWLRGNHATVALRVTAHPLAAALCHAVGHPLVSTSANRSGQRPLRTPLGVQRVLGKNLDCLLHGPLGGQRGPTEIRDGLTGGVLRR